MGTTEEGAASAAPFNPLTDSWRVFEMLEGQTLAGTVLRLPTPGAFNGSRLFLRTDAGDVLALRATAKSGHTKLARLLDQLEVKPGDQIVIVLSGWMTTKSRYEMRNYQVTLR